MSSRNGREVPSDARVPTIVNIHDNSERSSTPSSFYFVTNGHDIDDFIEVVDPQKMSGSPLDGATLQDVIKEAGGSFLIRKTRGNCESEHSSLMEIKDIPIKDVKVGDLRAFCVKVGLKGQDRATKQEIVYKLVNFKSASSGWENRTIHRDKLESGQPISICQCAFW